MSVDIGPRIGIDGEAEFRKNLNNINQQLRTLGAEMKAVTSAFTDSDDAQKALTAQAEVLTRQIGLQETKLAELRKMHERAVEDFGKTDDRTLKWAQSVYNATTALNKMKSQLSQTEQEISLLNSGMDETGDQEAEFQRNLENIDQRLKTLGSEMKVVTSAFTDSDNAQESLASQSKILTQQIEIQETKLAELRKAYEDSVNTLGKNDTKTLKWAQKVNEATAELNQMKSQLSQTEQKLSALSNGADDAGEQVEDLGETAQDSSGGLDTMKIAAGNLLADGIQAVISGIGDLISSLWNLDEATEEYRQNMGLLTTAFGSNGYGIETAKQSYKDLYAIIGDEGTATEATQLMATLSQSQQDLTTWTEVAAGVWGTFGESLPINSLMEAANETAKVGTVTGVLADALNWAGISEDQFNTILASATTEADRNRIILSALSSTYSGAADAFYQNNAALVESREAQADMDETLADLGATIADIKTTLLTAFLPAVEQAADGAADFLEDVDAEAVANTILALVDAFVRLSPVIAAATTAMIAYKAATTVAGIINTLTTAMSGATSATAAFTAALDANPIVLIVTIVLSLVAALVTLIATNEDVRDGFLAIWEAITSAVGTAVDWIAEKIQSIKDAFSGLVDGVKELLGIHSPSRVFKDIGENMAAGAELGWDSEWDKSRRQIEGSLDFSDLAEISPQIQAPANVIYVNDKTPALQGNGNAGGGGTKLLDITLELDGQTLAHKTYEYNEREGELRGSSLVEVGKK